MQTVAELLESYAELYLPTTISQARAKSAIKHLALLLGDSAAQEVNHQDLINYRASRPAVNPATLNRELAVLGSAYKWAGIECPRIPRTRETPRSQSITEAEIQKIIDRSHNLQTKAFTLLLFITGQRFSAVQTLKHCQIRGGVIEFEKDGYAKATRRKKRARTPLSAPIKTILLALVKEFGNTEYVIPPGRGESGYCKGMARWFRKAAESAGVNASPHVIRHSSATIAIEKEISLLEVSKFLGHSSLAITERVYLHQSPKFLTATVSALGENVKL